VGRDDLRNEGKVETEMDIGSRNRITLSVAVLLAIFVLVGGCESRSANRAAEITSIEVLTYPAFGIGHEMMDRIVTFNSDLTLTLTTRRKVSVDGDIFTRHERGEGPIISSITYRVSQSEWNNIRRTIIDNDFFELPESIRTTVQDGALRYVTVATNNDSHTVRGILPESGSIQLKNIVDALFEVRDSATSNPSNIMEIHAIEGLRPPPLGVGRGMSISDRPAFRPGDPLPVPGSMSPSPYANPPSYDLQMAIEKGLCGEDGFGSKYLHMQALYRLVFESWLLESTSLRKFDDRLHDSDLGFLPIVRSGWEYPRTFSTLGLPFIYMANNIPIERLDEDDLLLLLTALESGRTDITPELSDMVKRTFPDIIVANYDRNTNIGYRHNLSGPSAPRYAIILVMENEDFDEVGNFRDSAEVNQARAEFMAILAEEMEQVLSAQAQHCVYVVDYIGFRLPW